MNTQTQNYTELGIPQMIPLFNNDEKIDEVNHLLEILTKRKKWSIIVTMLYVFQHNNYQKLLKDYLEDGIKEIIIKNPLKVISYHGVPFTTNNFIRGVRVEYSRHKLFNREVIDNFEYIYVNLVYTCIFLSDEIAKICKGSNHLKLKTIHYSLIDEVEINNEPRKNIFTNEKQVNEKESEGIIVNNKASTNYYYTNELKNLDIDNELMNDIKTSNRTRRNNNSKYANKNFNESIINLDDSDNENEKEKEIPLNNPPQNNITSNIINKSNNKENVVYNYNNKNNKKNLNSKYRDELNLLKCTLKDILAVFDYSEDSPLNIYFVQNSENFDRLLEIFIRMQQIGENGQNCIESLIKTIPKSFNEEIINNNQNENIKEILIDDEQTQNKVSYINNLFEEYEKQKKILTYLFMTMQSTVKNIRHSGQEPNKLFIKNDIDYINKNEKKFDEVVDKIFKLLIEIYDYFEKEFQFKNIFNNLQNISSQLNSDDINIRVLYNFIQNFSGLLPPEAKVNNTNIYDLIANKKLNITDKEELFKQKMMEKKNLVLKYIEPLREILKKEE